MYIALALCDNRRMLVLVDLVQGPYPRLHVPLGAGSVQAGVHTGPLQGCERSVHNCAAKAVLVLKLLSPI